MYNRAAQFWHALYNIFSQYKLIKGRQWMHFFGSQQRFFRQMLMAAKAGPLSPAVSLQALHMSDKFCNHLQRLLADMLSARHLVASIATQKQLLLLTHN